MSHLNSALSDGDPHGGALRLGVSEGGHVLGDDVERHGRVSGGLHPRHLPPLAHRRELGVAELRRPPRDPVDELLRDGRGQRLVERDGPGEVTGRDGQVDASVPPDDVAAHGVDLVHAQDELRPAERVRRLVRHLHREVPDEFLLRAARGLARDLRDAVLRAVQVGPIVAVDDGVLAVRVVAARNLRLDGKRRGRDGSAMGAGVTFFARHRGLSGLF